MDANRDESAFDRAADDRQPDDRREHLGKERNDVDVQHAVVSFFVRLFGSVRRGASATPLAAGIAALDRQRFDEALEHFSAALDAAQSGRERGLVHNKRALTFLQRGDRPAAVGALVEALEADERCVPAIVNIGNLLLEDGAVDDAVAHFQAALRLDDTYAAGYLNLGIAYRKLGRRADAVRAFRRAHRLDARMRRPWPLARS